MYVVGQFLDFSETLKLSPLALFSSSPRYGYNDQNLWMIPVQRRLPYERGPCDFQMLVLYTAEGGSGRGTMAA